MAGAIVSALEYLGSRVEWEALSAIGTVCALVWAIKLGNQQSVDTRRREASMLKACLVPVTVVHEHLDGLWGLIEDLSDYDEDMDDIRPNEVAGAVRAAGAATSRAQRFLEGLDLLRLPTADAIVAIVELRTVLAEAFDQMASLAKRGTRIPQDQYPPAAVRAQELMFRLGTEAAKLGARAKHDDPFLVQLHLDPPESISLRLRALGHRVGNWRRQIFGLTPSERKIADEIPF